MKDQLELSQDEIALIESKRAEKQKELEESYEGKRAIEDAKNTIAKYKEEDAKELEAYQKYANELNKASNGNFELVVKELKCEEIPYFYKEGLERENLKAINYTRTSCSINYIGETVKHEFFHIDEDGDKMRYYGKDPIGDGAFRNEAKYSVSVSEHTSGYSYSKKNYGFKMSINGLQKEPHENRSNGKKITNAKTVIKKIQDDIEYRKSLVERDDFSRSLKSRALEIVNIFFPNAKDISEYKSKITVRFENGSSVEMRYYDDEESVTGVKLTTSSISAPSNASPLAIGNILKELV